MRAEVFGSHRQGHACVIPLRQSLQPELGAMDGRNGSDGPRPCTRQIPRSRAIYTFVSRISRAPRISSSAVVAHGL
jgi:hypothetical protein